MKFTWGTAIAIFYTLFAAGMVGMVVYSKNFDHALVAKDYYAEDLAYQSHLDKLNNSQSLLQDLAISQQGTAVALQFPQGFREISGEVKFYRADDEVKDFTVKIAPDAEGKLTIPTSGLTRGRWQLKVDWQGDGAFFKEVQLYFEDK